MKSNRRLTATTLSLLALLLSLALFGCDNKNSSTAPDDEVPNEFEFAAFSSDDYYPLVPGARWHYGEYSGSSIMYYTDFVNGERKTVNGHEGVPKTEYMIATDGDTIYESTPDILALVNDTVKYTVEGYSFWALPGAAALIPWHSSGDRIDWFFDDWDYSIIMRHDTTVTVPAGVFDSCAMILNVEYWSTDTTYQYEFFARGVGLVRIDELYITGGYAYPSSIQLLEYLIE